MPIAQAGRAPALNGTSWLPMTANAGVVMLNLCVLLPLVALMPYAIALKPAMHFSRHRWIYLEGYAPQPMPFPLAVWRIDAVALIVLCTLLLPVGAGKWNLGRGEGAVLIAAYCVYLMAVTVAGV